MNFFVDNNLSPKTARALDKLVEPGHRVTHLKDRFAAEAKDVEWMAALASELDWIIISGDINISRNPHEVAAWKQQGTQYSSLSLGG